MSPFSLSNSSNTVADIPVVQDQKLFFATNSNTSQHEYFNSSYIPSSHQPQNTHNMVTRSKAGISKIEAEVLTVTKDVEPSSVREAFEYTSSETRYAGGDRCFA